MEKLVERAEVSRIDDELYKLLKLMKKNIQKRKKPVRKNKKELIKLF